MSIELVGLPSHAIRGRPDLRVGGGYTTHPTGNAWSGVPQVQARPFSASHNPISKRVASFSAEGVKALEVVQGGATLWTAEADGSIKVRHGMDGTVTVPRPEAVATFAPPLDGGVCVRLRASSTAMWAGYSNGMVRVFDHLVVGQIYPKPEDEEEGIKFSPPHGAAVAFLTAGEGCMYSADTSGNIIKWLDFPECDDLTKLVESAGGLTQIANGAALAETGPDALTALAISGPYVAGGDKNGGVSLSEITPATGAVAETHKEQFVLLHAWDAGHGTVNTVTTTGGTLFTGGSDGYVRCWAFPTPEGGGGRGPKPLHELKTGGAVKRLQVDEHAHQVWVVDADGAVLKVESDAPYTVREGAGMNIGPFSDFVSFTTWDAMRVWSMGSNGANFSWFAQWSRAEHHMDSAIEKMEGVLKNDGAILAQWKAMTGELIQIDGDRKGKLIKVLESNNLKGLYVNYYRKWNLWLQRVWEINRRESIADVLSRQTTNTIMRDAYIKIGQYAHKKRVLRQKRAMCDNIMSMTTQGLRRVYWKKIDDFRHRKKAEAARTALGELLLANTELGMLRKYFRRTVRYTDRMAIQMKKRKFAKYMQRANDGEMRRLYWFRLFGYRSVTMRGKRAHVIGKALMANTKRGMISIYYKKFQEWGKGVRRGSQRRELADALRRCSDQGLMQAYQSKCDTWMDAKRHGYLNDELARQKELLARLQAKELEQLDLIKQKQSLQALRDELERLNREQARLLALKRAAELEYQKMLAQKKRKDDHTEDMKARSMTLDDAMARLKEQALNFDSDFTVIEKNYERLAGATHVSKDKEGAAKPVLSMFLQSHMNVKAQLANLKGHKVFVEENYWPTKGESFMEDCQKKRDAGDETWKAELKIEEDLGEVMTPPWDLDGRFGKIPDFQYNMIGPAIKTMVILYDSMTQTEKDDIKTDGEIVINAFNLMHLNENAIRTKERREKKEWTDAWWKKEGMVDMWKQLWAEYKGFDSWDKINKGSQQRHRAPLPGAPAKVQEY